MTIQIYSSQFILATKYEQSHQLDLLIEEYVNRYLTDIKFEAAFHDIELLRIDISAKMDLSEDVEIGKKVNERKEKAIYQYLYLDSRYLIKQDNWELHIKKFDFVRKIDAIRTFTPKKYIELVLLGLSKLLNQNEILNLEKDLIDEVEKNMDNYSFFSEEHAYLNFLLSLEGRVWLNSDESESFRETEVYPKWQLLMKKYQLNEYGVVKFD